MLIIDYDDAYTAKGQLKVSFEKKFLNYLDTHSKIRADLCSKGSKWCDCILADLKQNKASIRNIKAEIPHGRTLKQALLSTLLPYNNFTYMGTKKRYVLKLSPYRGAIGTKKISAIKSSENTKIKSKMVVKTMAKKTTKSRKKRTFRKGSFKDVKRGSVSLVNLIRQARIRRRDTTKGGKNTRYCGKIGEGIYIYKLEQ